MTARIIPFSNAPARAPARDSSPPAPVTHRQAGVAPPFKQWLDPHELARAARDGGMEAAINERLSTLRHRVIRPSLLDRLTGFLTSEAGFAFYCGVYAGALLTAVLAYAWTRVLL